MAVAADAVVRARVACERVVMAEQSAIRAHLRAARCHDATALTLDATAVDAGTDATLSAKIDRRAARKRQLASNARDRAQ